MSHRAPSAPPPSLLEIACREMARRGLLVEFSVDEMRELEGVVSAGPSVDGNGSVRDLRSLLWCSIDNVDSRDLDQLTVAETLPDGATRIWVGIADVDAMVDQGGLLDAHARHNTTTVYTPPRIFPMLPERLSTDLTSLNADQDRLALVAELRVSPGGEVLDSALYRAWVRNQARLSYEDVGPWLEGTGPLPPTVAACPGQEALLRVQDASALERFLRERKQADPAGHGDLSLRIVKMMGGGEYAVDDPAGPPVGHFALAVRDYAHSTAPNRRYPDVITHRLVKAALEKAPQPYTVADLEALAGHCTDRENDANRVERQVRKAAAAMWMADRLGEVFDAVVTGVTSRRDVFCRTLQPPVDGKIVRALGPLDVGETVRVRLVGVEVEPGFIDFEQVP